jgi:hypothetical protein
MTTEKKSPDNFANNREKTSETAKKDTHNSGGNFAHEREKASEAGKKGGQQHHSGSRQP